MFSSVMNRLHERRAAGFKGQEADAGFTLIELMVVLLIMAILLAIAIPTFLGVTGTANDRAAQANLNTTLTDGKAVYSANNQAYPAITGTVTTNVLAQSIAANEPSLGIQTANTTTGATVAAGQIIAYASTDGTAALYMSLAKNTKECWFVADNTSLVSANSPWVASATGVPLAAGEVYGDFLVGTTNTSCSPAALGTAVIAGATPASGQVIESSTGFPANAT